MALSWLINTTDGTMTPRADSWRKSPPHDNHRDNHLRVWPGIHSHILTGAHQSWLLTLTPAKTHPRSSKGRRRRYVRCIRDILALPTGLFFSPVLLGKVHDDDRLLAQARGLELVLGYSLHSVKRLFILIKNNNININMGFILELSIILI